MAQLRQLITWLAYFALSASVAGVSYDGFQAIRLPAGDNSKVVDDIVSRLNLDAWKYTRSYTDVLVPPHNLDAFKAEIQAADLNGTVLDPDIGASIAASPIVDMSE